jgi:hypothetical protein
MQPLARAAMLTKKLADLSGPFARAIRNRLDLHIRACGVPPRKIGGNLGSLMRA